MAFDPTNEVSLKKHLNVFSALKKGFGCELYQLTPKAVGFKKWEEICPVIYINVYVIDKGECEDISRTLKKILYNPAKGAKTDQFRLSTHGILGP